MKRFMIGLIIAIPAASIVLGVVMIVLATQSADYEVRDSSQPLSKTSWRDSLEREGNSLERELNSLERDANSLEREKP